MLWSHIYHADTPQMAFGILQLTLHAFMCAYGVTLTSLATLPSGGWHIQRSKLKVGNTLSRGEYRGELTIQALSTPTCCACVHACVCVCLCVLYCMLVCLGVFVHACTCYHL